MLIKSDGRGSVVQELRSVEGVDQKLSEKRVGDYTQVDFSLKADPQSQEAFDTVQQMRDVIAGIPEAEALVGGIDATHDATYTPYWKSVNVPTCS